VLLLTGLAWADDAKEKEQPGAPADQFKALSKEFDTAMTKLQDEFRAATDAEAKSKIRGQAMELLGKFATRAIEFAEKNPKSEDSAQALIWALQRARDEPTRDRAILALLKDQVQSKNIGSICTMLAELPNPSVEKLLRAVAEKNTDRKAQGLATLALATHLQSRADDAQGAEAEKLNKEAEKVLEGAVAKFADVQTDEGTVGEIAKATLGLAIGRTAPDISGEDAEDKKFKLSDYKGKVVMLDFWASWCGPCMAMVPHNRELVKKLEGRPFVLLGVNADQDKADFKKAQESAKINWRSFFDGSGKISTDWRIKAFPTMLLIDHKGVMRHKFVGGGPDTAKAIDKAIEELVKEAEADGTK
jgi:thiol-disulfide isomerase/thioredoxin